MKYGGFVIFFPETNSGNVAGPLWVLIIFILLSLGNEELKSQTSNQTQVKLQLWYSGCNLLATVYRLVVKRGDHHLEKVSRMHDAVNCPQFSSM